MRIAMLCLALTASGCASGPDVHAGDCLRLLVPAGYHTDGKLAGSSALPGQRSRFRDTDSTDQVLEVNCGEKLIGVEGEPSPTEGEPQPL